MLNMGPGGSWRVGTGIALPGTHPYPHPGYTPPLPALASRRVAAPRYQTNSAVGLKSVAQLTSRALFGNLLGFTEVYNLVRIEGDQ